MDSTATLTEPIAAPQAAPVIIAPVLSPAPVPQETPVATAPVAAPVDTYVHRFTPEQIANISTADAETARAWARTLTPHEQKLVVSGGLQALLPSAAPKTDPAPVPADPAAASVDLGTTPPENTEEPPAGDLPSWIMTEEELASASPKVLALYKDHLDATERLETAQAPVVDPYADDPVVAWRKSALERGVTDIPDFSADEIIASIPGGADALFDAMDQAHAAGDAAAWKAGLSTLIKAAVEQTKSRAIMQAKIQVKDAEAAKDEGFREGIFVSNVQSSVKGFLKSVPEFTKAAEPLFVSKDGREVLNEKNPGSEFVKYLQSEGDLFDQVARTKGTDRAVQLFWTNYQSDKVGGYNKMVAGIRTQEAATITSKARESFNSFMAKQAAPSVGSVLVPANGGANAPLYHGFDLRQVQTPEQAKKVYSSLYNAGNVAAANGLAAALQKVPR